MPVAKTLNERDTMLVRWLGEAHAKEAELEADLTAHIALTQKPTYKKRLQQHLKETRDHKRRVAARTKKLGGPAGQGLLAVPVTVGEVAGKTVAAVKGQVGMARALVSAQADTHLRNAQDELREEHTEIAIYTRIEVLASRGRGSRDGAARPRDPPRRGAHGEVPHRRARTARQRRRSRGDSARPASRLLGSRSRRTSSAPRGGRPPRARSASARKTAATSRSRSTASARTSRSRTAAARS